MSSAKAKPSAPVNNIAGKSYLTRTEIYYVCLFLRAMQLFSKDEGNTRRMTALLEEEEVILKDRSFHPRVMKIISGFEKRYRKRLNELDKNDTKAD